MDQAKDSNAAREADRFGDSHMHTPLCKHAHGAPAAYAERALAIGLERIAFTCHSPMPDGFWPEVRMDEDQFPLYLEMVDACRRRFAGRLEVCPGLEADFFPGTEGWMARLLDSVELDHVLGSVHWQGGEYQQRYWRGDHADFVRTYFDLLAASAECGLFDTLAHPDLVKNFFPDQWDFDQFEPDIAAALDRIAAAGTAMEFNTSGRNKVSGEFNPSARLLGMMAARGIPVVIGSDAHVPRRVGDAFGEALDWIDHAGYAEVTLFRRRQPYRVSVERAREVLERGTDGSRGDGSSVSAA